MPLRNRTGDAVDPVPFLVIVSFAFLLVFSAGPIYLRALLGMGIPTGLLVSAVVFLVLVGVAYYRYVYAARPELRGEVSSATRFLRLLYGAAAFGLILLGLMLPFAL